MGGGMMWHALGIGGCGRVWYGMMYMVVYVLDSRRVDRLGWLGGLGIIVGVWWG